MHFALTDEQLEMQESVRRFLSQACPMRRVHQLFDSQEHDRQLWKELTGLGVTGLSLPAEYGGSDLELLDVALIAEVLGAAAAPGPFLGQVAAGLAIAWAGTPRQKADWLPGIASGELLATVALAEAGSRWHPREWQLTRQPKLSGEKTFMIGGGDPQLIVVGVAGGELAIVDSRGGGLERKRLPAADRTRLLESVTFSGATCEPLSEHSVEAAQRLYDAMLVLIAADAFGGASRCVSMAADYANIREQFGMKIGQFQGVKHPIANMQVSIEPARALYWHAAHAFDRLPEDASRAAALAKAHLGDGFLQAARDTVELHGGIGYTWECDVQIFLKRAMFDFAYMGAPALHRERAAVMAAW